MDATGLVIQLHLSIFLYFFHSFYPFLALFQGGLIQKKNSSFSLSYLKKLEIMKNMGILLKIKAHINFYFLNDYQIYYTPYPGILMWGNIHHYVSKAETQFVLFMLMKSHTTSSHINCDEQVA